MRETKSIQGKSTKTKVHRSRQNKKKLASKHMEIKAREHVHTKATMTIWQRVGGNTGYKQDKRNCSQDTGV